MASEVATILTAPDRMLYELGDEMKRNDGMALMTKLIGGTPDDPQPPRVTLLAKVNAYGTPTASVTVKRTDRDKDTSCSLDDLELRTACEYYLHLDSVEALNAIEKSVNSPTPKAWMFITLLERMKKEIA